MTSNAQAGPSDAEIASVPWYHTIRLPDGRLTPGYFDVQAVADRSGLPDSLEGKRCLDVGTCDGFWAFEMERRGAAEVVGIDLDDTTRRDWPARVPLDARGGDSGRSQKTFAMISAALGSSVERVDMSVYDLSPERLGSFDFVFMGNLLLHLRDPVRALEAVRTVTGDRFLSLDSFNPTLSLLRPRTSVARLDGSGYSIWWTVNLAGRRRIVEIAGFDVIDSGRPYLLRFGPGHTPGPPRLPRRIGGLRQELSRQVLGRLGSANSWLLCRPAL